MESNQTKRLKRIKEIRKDDVLDPQRIVNEELLELSKKIDYLIQDSGRLNRELTELKVRENNRKRMGSSKG